MIGIGVRYLCGYSVAADPSAQQPEWPPHPGRVFMAMAAAHFESGADAVERAALEWLEREPAPAIRASDANDRVAVESYVPVNDKHGGIVRRLRQSRTFQKTRPDEDTVFLVWQADPPAEIRAALGNICSKVTRLGHSTSLVQMWVVPARDEPEANWKPQPSNGEVQFRVAEPDTMGHLESAFNGKAIEEYYRLATELEVAPTKDRRNLKARRSAAFPNGEPTYQRPQLSTWQGYSRVTTAEAQWRAANGPFDSEIVILTLSEGRILGLESTLQLTGALRNAVMKATDGESQPEWLTGHTRDSRPSERPHLAFFPLAFVGHLHADGHIMGLGIAIPRDLGHESSSGRADELRRYLGKGFFDQTGAERQVHLWRDGVWDWKLDREKRERPPHTLRPESWTGPALSWASVTPVVLHHHPKKSRPNDVERLVREAFDSALLPQPGVVEIGPISALAGAGHIRDIPTFDAGGDGLCRYQTHVVARYSQPVIGPVLVGRGRYRGYGLFSPLPQELGRG
jgi:CRISPR-associated protein Csb2